MNAAGGSLAVQGGVGSMVVVVVEPGLVGGLALGLAGVGVGVGPLAGQSAVKELTLASGTDQRNTVLGELGLESGTVVVLVGDDHLTPPRCP